MYSCIDETGSRLDAVHSSLDVEGGGAGPVSLQLDWSIYISSSR